MITFLTSSLFLEKRPVVGYLRNYIPLRALPTYRGKTLVSTHSDNSDDLLTRQEELAY